MTLDLPVFPMAPSPGSEETPTSLVSRFSAINGYPSMSHFCELVGHKAYDFASGKRETLNWLASFVGGPPDRFAGALTGRGDEFRIAGELLRRRDLRRLRLRVCPRCIAEDLEVEGYPEHVRPYGRVWWQIGPLRSCPRHGVAYREIDASDASAALGGVDFAIALRRNIPEICKVADDCAPCPPSERESYLLARLRGLLHCRSDVLDDMPFYAAVRACEVVGAVALSGPDAGTENLDDDAMHEVADRGFEILSAGSEALMDLMRTMVERVLEHPNAKWGIRPMLGALHDSFSHRNTDPAFDAIRTIVRTFVLETMPLGPKEKIFGSAIGERRIHSIRSLALETGLHPKTIRKRLTADGVIPVEASAVRDDRVTVSVAATGIVPEISGKVFDVAKLGRHLKIPRVHLSLIGKSGLIPPVRSPDSAGSTRAAFTLKEVERFRARLFAGAIEVAEPPPGFADITVVRGRCCRGIIEVLELVLDEGRVRKARLKDRFDYEALLLDIDEVKSLMQDEDHGGVPIYKVPTLIGVGDRVTGRLIENGILPVRTARNATNRGMQRIVDRLAIDQFRRTFVSLSDLAQERGVDRQAVRREVSAHGVRPAFDADQVGAIIYRRCDLP